ncbi:MAG: Rieske (2Fe-2S) protein [Acidimicrobiales bacterium]
MSVVDAGALDDFTNGGTRQVTLDGHVVVVVRIGDDVYVLDDRCSHEDFSLARGEVDEEFATIECARHGAQFSLADGAALTLPATHPVRRYEAVIRDGRVEVSLA